MKEVSISLRYSCTNGSLYRNKTHVWQQNDVSVKKKKSSCKSSLTDWQYHQYLNNSNKNVQGVRTVFTGYVYLSNVFWALQQLDFISESVLKFWRTPPKSNKHQGCLLGSWPEAPVCSWEQRQTLADPLAIWDKEHTNKTWISKQCGKLFDTRGNTVQF